MMNSKPKRFSGVLPCHSFETGSGAPEKAVPALAPDVEFRGFSKALAQIPHCEYRTVIGELRQALGISSRSGLHDYRTGKVRLRADQAVKVQEVFHNRGIENPWDA